MEYGVKEYSLKEAADLLGVSTYTLRRRIKDGSIVSILKFGRYYIEETELEEYITNLTISKENCIYFKKCGNIKVEFKNSKEEELILNKDFVKEVSNIINSGIRLEPKSDVVRIYYKLLQKRGEL